MVNSIAPDIACIHVAWQVEVNGIPANTESLAGILKLHILYSGCYQALVFILGADDDDRAHLVMTELLSKLASKTGLESIPKGNSRVKVLLASW